MLKRNSGSKAYLPADKGKSKLPPWAPWLIAYACVVLCAFSLVYFWRVIFELGEVLPQLEFSLYIIIIFSALFAAFYFALRFGKENNSLTAVLILFTIGLVFCFATAPLQVPDEGKHFLRAYSVSTGKFNYDYNRSYPDDVAALINVFGSRSINHDVKFNSGGLVPSFILQYKELISGAAVFTEKVSEPIMQIFLPFLPQALFIFFARLMGFSALGQMYAGRIAALLVYCLICYKAFRNCDKYRGVFIATAFLPMSLFMAASNSYDSMMLALTYLIISYFCKKEVYNRDIIVMALAIAMVTYIKSLNIVLAFVLLLIPKERWKSKWKPWAVFAIVFAGAVLVFVGFGKIDGSLLSKNYPSKDEMPRGVGEGAMPKEQLLFVLKYPLRFISVTIQSLVENALYLFKIGTFGAMDMEIAIVSGLSVISLCAASALGIQQKEDTKKGGAWGIFLMAMLYAASIMAGIYVLDSHYGSIRVTGVQPRYFLPAFLLIFMLFSILLGKGVKPRLSGEQVAASTERIIIYISAAIAFISVMLILQNYFIGQWLPKGEGGWKMVNLFGWQQY